MWLLRVWGLGFRVYVLGLWYNGRCKNDGEFTFLAEGDSTALLLSGLVKYSRARGVSLVLVFCTGSRVSRCEALPLSFGIQGVGLGFRGLGV